MSKKFLKLVVISICLFALAGCDSAESLEVEINELREENENLELASYNLDKQLKQIIDICSVYECPDFQSDTPYGIKTITGYYQKTNKIDWGEVEIVCDTFVITDGPEAFIDKYKRLVEIGNTVNSLNDDEQVVFNINIDNLGKSDMIKVTNSSQKNQIELTILNPFVDGGRGVPTCYSFVSILKVK